MNTQPPAFSQHTAMVWLVYAAVASSLTTYVLEKLFLGTLLTPMIGLGMAFGIATATVFWHLGGQQSSWMKLFIWILSTTAIGFGVAVGYIATVLPPGFPDGTLPGWEPDPSKWFVLSVGGALFVLAAWTAIIRNRVHLHEYILSVVLTGLPPALLLATVFNRAVSHITQSEVHLIIMLLWQCTIVACIGWILGRQQRMIKQDQMRFL